MKIATSTGDFARYCNNDLERIEELHRAGFRHIDLSQYSLTRNRDLLFDDDWKETVKKLQARADELGMEFVQSHAPGGELLDPNPEKRELLIQATIRSIHVAGELGIKLLVIHAGCEPYLTQEELYEKNLHVFKRF